MSRSPLIALLVVLLGPLMINFPLLRASGSRLDLPYLEGPSEDVGGSSQATAESPTTSQPQQDYPQQQSKDHNQSLQLILARLISNLWQQQQHSANPTHNQQEEPPTGTSNHYAPEPQQQWPYYHSGGNNNNAAGQTSFPQELATSTWPAPPRQLVSVQSNQLYYPPSERPPSPTYLSAATGSPAPAGQVGAAHYYLDLARPAPPPSPAYSQPEASPPSSSWPLLAYLAQNKANLSHLIQLLPLLAQTMAVLPRVFTAASLAPAASNSSASSLVEQLVQRASSAWLAERVGVAKPAAASPALSTGAALAGELARRWIGRLAANQQRTAYELSETATPTSPPGNRWGERLAAYLAGRLRNQVEPREVRWPAAKSGVSHAHKA